MYIEAEENLLDKVELLEDGAKDDIEDGETTRLDIVIQVYLFVIIHRYLLLNSLLSQLSLLHVYYFTNALVSVRPEA